MHTMKCLGLFFQFCFVLFFLLFGLSLTRSLSISSIRVSFEKNNNILFLLFEMLCILINPTALEFRGITITNQAKNNKMLRIHAQRNLFHIASNMYTLLYTEQYLQNNFENSVYIFFSFGFCYYYSLSFIYLFFGVVFFLNTVYNLFADPLLSALLFPLSKSVQTNIVIYRARI